MEKDYEKISLGRQLLPLAGAAQALSCLFKTQCNYAEILAVFLLFDERNEQGQTWWQMVL